MASAFCRILLFSLASLLCFACSSGGIKTRPNPATGGNGGSSGTLSSGGIGGTPITSALGEPLAHRHLPLRAGAPEHRHLPLRAGSPERRRLPLRAGPAARTPGLRRMPATHWWTEGRGSPSSKRPMFGSTSMNSSTARGSSDGTADRITSRGFASLPARPVLPAAISRCWPPTLPYPPTWPTAHAAALAAGRPPKDYPRWICCQCRRAARERYLPSTPSAPSAGPARLSLKPRS